MGINPFCRNGKGLWNMEVVHSGLLPLWQGCLARVQIWTLVHAWCYVRYGLGCIWGIPAAMGHQQQSRRRGTPLGTGSQLPYPVYLPEIDDGEPAGTLDHLLRQGLARDGLTETGCAMSQY